MSEERGDSGMGIEPLLIEEEMKESFLMDLFTTVGKEDRRQYLVLLFAHFGKRDLAAVVKEIVGPAGALDLFSAQVRQPWH